MICLANLVQVKKQNATPQVDNKEQKKLDELKKASAEYLNQLNEATLSELQLEVKHYQESIAKLNDYLQKAR